MPAPTRAIRQGSSSSSNTSVTATFAEPTPLDNTYLLVAVVWWVINPGAYCPVPSGWTQITGTPSSFKVGQIFIRQGNGSVNSITVTNTAAGGAFITLMAFPGYKTLTPIAASSVVSVGTSMTFNPTPTPTGKYGVSLARLQLDGNAVFNSWTNSYTRPVAATSWVDDVWKHYDGTGTYDTNITWSSYRDFVAMYAILELKSPVTRSYAYGDIPVTLAAKDAPHELFIGDTGV